MHIKVSGTGDNSVIVLEKVNVKQHATAPEVSDFVVALHQTG